MTPPRPNRARRPEKQVQADVVRLFRQFGGEVIDTSQPFAAAITPGLADLLVFFPRRHQMCFFETKAAGGRQSAAQQRFQGLVEACGGHYVLGGMDEAIAYLQEIGLVPTTYRRAGLAAGR